MLPALIASLSTLSAAQDVEFALEVRPLLARKCFACHGNDEETREAGLRLDLREPATADRDGFPAIVPGVPGDSEMWIRISDEFDPMPPAHAGEPLDEAERALIRKWIESGAEYTPHWAFVPPARPELPQVFKDEAHPIDLFIERALGVRGLTLSERASDETLFRRLSLDLTGLPPSADDVRRFATSRNPEKVEIAIEQLLASPAYAERWAAVWLDLARYADSAGHGSDPLRTIWRYRDWVIEAFDENMPFDEFTIQQLAGDLIDHPTTSTRLATAFHRNTMTNTEGGTDDEEFRVLAVKDRVSTTMQVWMGLTAECAECHSHKYDPISHVEYYSLFDIFNQTADTDRADEFPRIPTPTRDQAADFARVTEAIESVDRVLEERAASFGVDLDAERAIRTRMANDRIEYGHATIAKLEPGEFAVARPGRGHLIAGSGAHATRTLTVDALTRPPTALVVEALSDPSLPKNGPGRNPASGNFVLTNLSVRALPLEPSFKTAHAVRVVLPGESRILSLAEVEVIGPDGDVVDRAGTASQSSTDFGGPAERAFDGRTDGAFELGSVTHTRASTDPWWRVDLDQPAIVAGIRVWTRTDGDLSSRLHGLRVELLGDNDESLWISAPAPAFEESTLIGPAVGEPLRLRATSATHEQPKFEAARAVDGRRSIEDGWAVGGGEGVDQSAVFALPELNAPRRLVVELEHRWGTDHVLGAFRIGVATSEEPPLAVAAATQIPLALDADDRTDEQRAAVRRLLEAHDPKIASLRLRRAELASERESLGVVTTPVMRELEERRETHVLVRGNYRQLGERVHAALPAAFAAGARDVIGDGPLDRLGFARWLVSDANPLTARVAVNRVWSRLFGRGLVLSEGDFGSQGEPPTHPDLLDWLAVEFRDGGEHIERAWDFKDLVRTIVSSRTYQQSSIVRESSAELDPGAAWLSRYPRQRLEAEMVRDTALQVAGLLAPKRFGPSVYPPQPDGLWQAAFNGQRDWMTSTGEDRYRRGLYVFMRRTIPYPMMDTFDAPSRETCTVRRLPTNTPLQAFVTLNDPVFVEAAQAFGRELAAFSPDRRAAIEEGFWRATGRAPSPEQVDLASALFDDAIAAFGDDPGGARAFAEEPLGVLSDGADPILAAAWTLVSSSLLNLDATLTKE